MNLTWHIIKKDLIYFRWSLAVWLGSFAYLFFLQGNVTLSRSAEVQDYFQVFALMLFGLLTLGLLAGLVQQDHPNDSSGFWRTKPISAGRLVSAKLLQVGGLFIVLPLAAVVVKNHFAELKTLQFGGEYGLMALILASVTLSFVAAATCTRNTLHSVLLWVVVIFATGSLAEILGRFAPGVNRQVAAQLTTPRVLAVLEFSTASALAIILNQYLRRQLSASIVLLVFGSIGTAVIGSAWGYYYFFHP